MSSEDPRIVRPEALHAFAVRALSAVGMPAPQRIDTADAMIWSDLRGLLAHGVVRRLAQCVRRIQEGGTAPAAVPTVVTRTTAVASMEAHHAWGQVAGTAAMRLALDMAHTAGIGLVTIRETSSPAALGYYPSHAVWEGFIGLAITNGPPLMTPPGGSVKVIGNQAHAFSVPAGRYPPVLYDSALSMMSTGEMDRRLAAGEPLPEGVLYDHHGNPTTDPADWVEGILAPIGGYRGFGLGLIFELLTSALAAADRPGFRITHPFDHGRNQGVSMSCLAVDPSVIQPRDQFTAKVDHLIEAVHTAHSPGREQPHVPGERQHRLAIQRSDKGIPIAPQHWDDLRDLAAELGVEPPE